ncbi:MAG: AlkA N-terminal domain-containing protein [Caulobacteraceae bacterium]|nr:AlkA N-terminal domain-containing protein [Caulobacteraceae bacterium]
MTALDLDRDACYRALETRDARFDGRFYTAVRTTGIFCRPICPARTPKLENCIFLPSAAAAHQMGFRPCLRCRPEVAPGVASWRGSAATVSRALHLIAEGAMDGAGVETLAERLGVGARHLRRLFDQHVGAAPVSVAQTHRILFAKTLINETALSMTDVALAAGFGSVRRFNAVMQATYGRPPSELHSSAKTAVGESAGVTLKLPFGPPYDWAAMVEFLGPRAIPGVEQVEPDRYRRSVALGGARGVVEVRPAPGHNHLIATIWTSDVSALAAIVARLRRLFDLDADILAIDAHLSADPRLAPLVRARPGLRVPGAWDGFELAVRAVLGQQVSVRAATTFAGRLTAAHGEPLGLAGSPTDAPDRLFPTPEAVAVAELTAIGLTRARAATLNALGRAMAADRGLLRAYETLEETTLKLTALPGVGPWTAQYVAMRALREPDAFPASDLGLLRAMETAQGRPSPAALSAMAETWRPWRAYAALRLWMQGAPAPALALAS